MSICKNLKNVSTIISKRSRRLHVYLYIAAGLVFFCAVTGFFLIVYKSAPNMHVYPENPRQGDTVFVRVKSDKGDVVGDFDGEKLVFFKKGNSNEWMAFLGIDADLKPGGYEISVYIFEDTQGVAREKLSAKEINVSLADFSSASVAIAPSKEQTGYTQSQAVNNIVKNDGPTIKKVLDKFTPIPYFTEPFSFPLSETKIGGFSFGKFIRFGENKMQHFGVDLTAPEKTEVYAVNDGKVVATLNLSNYGKTVIIDHGLDIFSLYLHLERFNVSEGQMVRKGHVLGLSGETGYVTAPHLHFSMRVGTSRVDPLAFINVTKNMSYNFMLADLKQAVENIINR